MRPSWVEVDLDAIEFNTRQVAHHIAPAELCAVVKADAYGHGDVPVALAAIAGGASSLAVALVEEGVRLREADVDVPILVLSEPSEEDLPSVVKHGLTPTVYRLGFVGLLAEAASMATTVPYPVHLKLDTGMHRVGAAPIEAFEVARAVDRDDRLALQGVFTHFSVADEDVEYTRRQNTALVRFVEALAGEGIEPRIVHAANTAAALDLPETHHDMCRVGLGLYGLRPRPGSGEAVVLRPAMRVVSHVRYVRRVPSGARPSYGRIKEVDGPSTIVTVPIGYADGVRRKLAVPGSVLINAKRYDFAGQITMDMVVVDVGSDRVAVGDEVVLLGVQGDQQISAEEWADMLGTINYEVVCDFGPRMPRRYTRGGRLHA
ncbi:MAG: alanine racemase [Acidimicrobiia bacterium]|nr:MAG: alanine racemase [Acidimicrobiia bacterium]